MPVSRVANKGVWVGIVPSVTGRRFCRARLPASARVKAMIPNRATNMQNPSERLSQGWSAERPANAEPLLLAAEV